MAKGAQELYDVLKGIGNTGDAVFPGIVKAVHSDDTIDVDAEGLTYYEVRLKAAVAANQKGILPKPKIGSVVIVERIGDERSTEFQVALCSELDGYGIEISTVKFWIDAQGLLLQKGNDSLAKVLDDLLGEILKIYAPMNKPAITLIKQRAAQLLK